MKTKPRTLSDELSIKLMTITPEIAENFLLSNFENRKLTEGNVKFIAQQIKEGQWRDTGDAKVKFSKTGRLLDGQHFLHAVIMAGKPAVTRVARGLEEEVFKVLDTGKNRSSSDLLSTKGFKNPNELSAGIRGILKWEANEYQSTAKQRSATSTNAKILEFAEKNGEIQEIVTWLNVNVYRKFRYMSCSNLIMLYWLFKKRHQGKCDEFFQKYAIGADLGVHHPIKALRDKLLKESMNKRRLPDREKLALFILSWNAFREGKELKQLSFISSSKMPQPI